MRMIPEIDKIIFEMAAKKVGPEQRFFHDTSINNSTISLTKSIQARKQIQRMLGNVTTEAHRFEKLGRSKQIQRTDSPIVGLYVLRLSISGGSLNSNNNRLGCVPARV